MFGAGKKSFISFTYKMEVHVTKVQSQYSVWLVLQWVRILHCRCIAQYFPPGSARCPSLYHWGEARVRDRKLLCILARSRSIYHRTHKKSFRGPPKHNQRGTKRKLLLGNCCLSSKLLDGRPEFPERYIERVDNAELNLTIGLENGMHFNSRNLYYLKTIFIGRI